MIVDAHYHLEARMQPLAQLLEQMDRHKVDRIALIATMNDPFPWNAMAEMMAGTERSMLLSRSPDPALGIYRSMVSTEGDFSLLGKKYRVYPIPDNAPVAAAMERYPGRFYGWIFVNPSAAYVDKRICIQAIKALGAHRCLAGTDGPYTAADHGKMVEGIRRLPISEAERECIPGGNFQELIRG